MVTLTVNGTSHTVEAAADTPLLWVLREQIGLTGTKYGCGIGECGACNVHMNGELAKSCQISLGTLVRFSTLEKRKYLFVLRSGVAKRGSNFSVAPTVAKYLLFNGRCVPISSFGIFSSEI